MPPDLLDLWTSFLQRTLLNKYSDRSAGSKLYLNPPPGPDSAKTRIRDVQNGRQQFPNRCTTMQFPLCTEFYRGLHRIFVFIMKIIYHKSINISDTFLIVFNASKPCLKVLHKKTQETPAKRLTNRIIYSSTVLRRETGFGLQIVHNVIHYSFLPRSPFGTPGNLAISGRFLF